MTRQGKGDDVGVAGAASETGPVPDLPIVDAHHHFWDLESGRVRYPWLQEAPPTDFRYGDTRPLRRSYGPADYARDTAGHRIVATVHMEAESDPADPVAETRWLHEVAAVHGRPHAIVARAFLEREDVAEVLAAQAAFPLVRGIRQKPCAALTPASARRGEPGSMDDPRWRDGYTLLARHGLHYELQTPWWHLDAAAAVARDFPSTSLILNHTGLPDDRSAARLAAWRRALEGLAAEPNTALKLSGLGQPGHAWTVAANGPVVRDAIAIFGADRCCFASNFPVDGLCATFDTIFRGFRAIAADYPHSVQRALLHDNAVRLYRLDAAAQLHFSDTETP